LRLCLSRVSWNYMGLICSQNFDFTGLPLVEVALGAQIATGTWVRLCGSEHVSSLLEESFD